MKQLMKEANYKAATIDWLIKKGLLGDNSILINELPVDNFNRRADLVVANGKLHAFEIKSDADSLSRLKGQITTYLDFFDKVTVICSPRYTQKALNILPERVEVLEFVYSINKPNTLKIARRGRSINISNHFNYLSFVEKKILVSALKEKGLACNPNETRTALCSKLGLLPKNFWRSLVINYLKSKYRNTHETFFSHKGKETKISDLYLLSPRNNNPQCNSKISDENIISDFHTKPENDQNIHIEQYGIDISKNMQKIGFVTPNAIRIIPRIKNK